MFLTLPYLILQHNIRESVATLGDRSVMPTVLQKELNLWYMRLVERDDSEPLDVKSFVVHFWMLGVTMS